MKNTQNMDFNWDNANIRPTPCSQFDWVSL